MGVTTSKTTFKIPGLANSDGTFGIWPHSDRSPVFTAAGHDWSFIYYPHSLYDGDSVDLCLVLESSGSEVKISSSVDLLDPTGTLPPLNLVVPSPPMSFDSEDDDRNMVTHWVFKSKLSEALRHGYLQAQVGALLFEWTITVVPDTAMPMPMPMPMPLPEPGLIHIPESPSPKPEAEPIYIPEFMSIPEVPWPEVPTTDVVPEPIMPKVPATDVTYSVGGELFHAHKVILATQSPVFKAELAEAMKKQQALEGAPAAVIEVDGMMPDVFEALLHYIYTDTLPDTTEAQSDDDAGSQLMRDLLVAADRYDLERLKLLCERKLSKIVGVENVAEMLAFADDHYCCELEDACIEFMVTSGRMKEVVESTGYQRLRRKHPLILVDVLEKFLIFRNVY